METAAATRTAPASRDPDEVDPIKGTTPAEEAAADAVIEALRAEDPDVYLEKVRTPVARTVDDAVGFRRLLGVLKVVDQGTFQMTNEKAANTDPAQRATVDRLTFNKAVVYPTGPDLAALIKRYPYIVKVWAGEAAEMSGAFRGSEREKV